MKELKRIKGFGKDTLKDIIINLIRTSTICGDAFAEIIRDKAGRMTNLIIRNPASIEIQCNSKGIITGYQQIGYKTGKNGEQEKVNIGDPWKPEEIFHLCWNRIADEPHGISTIQKIESIILKKKEAEEVKEGLSEFEEEGCNAIQAKMNYLERKINQSIKKLRLNIKKQFLFFDYPNS